MRVKKERMGHSGAKGVGTDHNGGSGGGEEHFGTRDEDCAEWHQHPQPHSASRRKAKL